ncbi:hypothetical protein ACFLZC_02460 [Patescibacteria group bacterium]
MRDMVKKYHHGYLLVGDMEEGLNKALEMSADILGIKKESLLAHPDFSLLGLEGFGIGDARQIKEKSSKKSFHGKGRIFVIRSSTFTGEACNALLKTFEEPAGLSYFFVVTSSVENILETLRSRLMVLDTAGEKELPEKNKEFTEKFLKAGVDKRMDMVRPFVTEKEKVRNFLDSLESVLQEKVSQNLSKELVKALDEIANSRQMLSQRASSSKMIVDYICLVLTKRE